MKRGTESRAIIETDDVMTQSNKPFRDLPGGLLDRLRKIAEPPPNDPPGDSFAWKPAPMPPRPRSPADSIALDEPDED
jgi:hypothetical protein